MIKQERNSNWQFTKLRRIIVESMQNRVRTSKSIREVYCKTNYKSCTSTDTSGLSLGSIRYLWMHHIITLRLYKIRLNHYYKHIASLLPESRINACQHGRPQVRARGGDLPASPVLYTLQSWKSFWILEDIPRF